MLLKGRCGDMQQQYILLHRLEVGCKWSERNQWPK